MALVGAAVALPSGAALALGVSTVLSETIVGVAIVMAQVGCFVPAADASLPVVHHLSAIPRHDDDGQDAECVGRSSTFLTEMTDVAQLLRSASPRSVVLVDELGRGTSTFDGAAIAL